MPKNTSASKKTKKNAAPKAAKKNDKPKTRSKAGNGHAKPTFAQLSEEQRQTLLHSHKAKMKPLLAALKEAQADVNAGFELAKKEGVTKNRLQLAIELETEEGREKFHARLQGEIEVARHSNVPIQIEMFGISKQSAKEKVFADGRIAGMSDEKRRPPAELHTNMHNEWIAGFDEGRKALSTMRASSGFKPLADTVADLAKRAGVSASLEEGEETDHQEERKEAA